ncbi:hypothetical protein NDU88_009234 [Pleurodeles waltl]|uniref:Uncharacterized protein n=1 Tax=Pleurodeles waltl TaxID=8319 RepID=A0AAV7QU06_PLEWA|nr:hypothetical protein NDU88_009234 [Pleurodeles waltl]
MHRGSAGWRSGESLASLLPPGSCEVGGPAAWSTNALAARVPPGLRSALEPGPTGRRRLAGVEVGPLGPDWLSSVGAPVGEALPDPRVLIPQGVPGAPTQDPEGVEGGQPRWGGCPELEPTAEVVIVRQGALWQDISIGMAGDECDRGSGRSCLGAARLLKHGVGGPGDGETREAAWHGPWPPLLTGIYSLRGRAAVEPHAGKNVKIVVLATGIDGYGRLVVRAAVC